MGSVAIFCAYITVSKIVEVQKDFSPRIVKAKGSIQQYPDWNEDEFDYE